MKIPSARARHVTHLPLGTFSELGIANRKHLVNQHYLGLEMCRHCEGQTDVHATRIALHGSIDEFLNAGEIYDFIELLTISARRIPRIEPLRKMLSRPVNSG